MPKETLAKLNLTKGTNLILQENGNIGFIVCKVEHYDNWLARLNQELEALDVQSKTQFKSIIKVLSKTEEKEEIHKI